MHFKHLAIASGFGGALWLCIVCSCFNVLCAIQHWAAILEATAVRVSGAGFLADLEKNTGFCPELDSGATLVTSYCPWTWDVITGACLHYPCSRVVIHDNCRGIVLIAWCYQTIICYHIWRKLIICCSVPAGTMNTAHELPIVIIVRFYNQTDKVLKCIWENIRHGPVGYWSVASC